MTTKIAIKKTSKKGTTNTCSRDEDDYRRTRSKKLMNTEMSAAHEWAKRLNDSAIPTIGALLVWARHAREAGHWLSISVGYSDSEESPIETANIDYHKGSSGSIWLRISEVIYERTGFISDDIELNDLAIMAECGSKVQGREDLKIAYTKFVSATRQINVAQLIGELQMKFPVATANLPKPPVKGQWSIWMNKSAVEEILNCDGRYFDDLYPNEIESRARKQWRFRLDTRDEHVLKKYAQLLDEQRSKNRI